MKSFSSSTQKHKVIVLLTDGENHEDDPVSVASELAAQGVRVYPIGVGTPFGEPIPIRDERGSVVGYKKDENGSVVMSRLDEATLQQIASTTGGVYYRSTLAEGEIGSLMEEIGKLDAAEFESREFTRYEERYQIALALGLLFLIIELALSDRRLPGAQWMGRFE
jgi:Ca-activated chloride channel family protein